MKVSSEIDNNFGYEKITQLVDNIPLNMRIFVVIADCGGFNFTKDANNKMYLVSIQFCTSSFNEILFSVVLCVWAE